VSSTTASQDSNSQRKICLIYCDDAAFTDADAEASVVSLDFLRYDKPLDLLKAFIYSKHKYVQTRLDAVCADLTRVTGASWNKRFKAKYGPIEKFLRKHDDTFELSGSEEARIVRLKKHDHISIITSSKHQLEQELFETGATELVNGCHDERTKQQSKQSVQE